MAKQAIRLIGEGGGGEVRCGQVIILTNLIATKLCIKLLLNHYFNDNNLYDDSNYKNNINLRLCNYNKNKNIDLRLNNNDYD